MKQSSIDFLVQKLAENVIIHSFDINEAKQMHKQEIEHAHLHNRCSGDQSSKCFIEALGNAEQYYNTTFKSE
jgi:hypothetical protein